MVETVIETRDLSKRFGEVNAVQGLNLSVRRGEVYGFLGLNGAGKTTTVRMLAGVIPPTSGSGRVMGYDIADHSERMAHQIGVVFGENITPEPGFSPVRYLRHFARLYGLRAGEADNRAQRLFDLLGLNEYAERPIGELSGGNQRKVEIARALLHGPSLLFLDEPTRELDIPAKRSIWRLFNHLAQSGEVTIFLSSHDVQEIATLCTRIGTIRHGVKTWEGPASAVIQEENASLVDALITRIEKPEAKP